MASSSGASHKTTDSFGASSLHSSLLREISKEKNVYQKYQVVEILGEGSMGAVSKVQKRESAIGGSATTSTDGPPKKKGLLGLGLFHRNKKGGGDVRKFQSNHPEDHIYALKSIQLDRVSSMFLEELKNEIGILRSLDHPNIVKAYEVFYERKQIYLLLELCDGGDLYTRSPYTERQAGQITASILSAIRYMHEHGVVHRDLKYENCMHSDCSNEATVKIIDFGLSKKFLSGKPGVMSERVGTIYTMSPQVLQGMYSSQADLWSIGVIAFMLLSSTKPFYHRRRRVIIDLIMRGAYNFNMPTWTQISDEAKDFVQKLLVVDPKQRMTAEQALSHPWIVGREKLSNELPSDEVFATIDDSLLNYRHTSELKKLALTVIAHRSTQKEIMELRKWFEQYDTERDGVLSYEEFQAALMKMNYSDEELQEIFQSLDINQNGHIMWTEFLAATIEAHGHVEEARIAEAFDRLDADDSGFISRANLREFLGKDVPEAQVEAILKSADTNNDGKISYDEFLAAFRTQTHQVADQYAHMETTSSVEDDSKLLGIDASIPGGKEDVMA